MICPSSAPAAIIDLISVTSYKMKTVATCGFGSGIYRIGNRTRYNTNVTDNSRIKAKVARALVARCGLVAYIWGIAKG